MFEALSALLYVPAIVWVASGIGMGMAVRRSSAALLLRLAAVFLALWALLATTVLVWVLAHGGLSGVEGLLRSPADIFGPSSLNLWVGGAFGAFAVLLVAFVLNQLVGRGLLRLLRPQPMDWPGSLPRPRTDTRLLSFASPTPQAFSFTLLDWSRAGGPKRREIVLLSSGALERFDPSEIRAALAHELAHLVRLDGRYLTFVRTIARMMRWDPVLALLARSLTRSEEYEADRAAVRLTGNPRALARALYKTLQLAAPRAPAIPSAFLGARGRSGERQAVERIRRLLEMAESGGFPEETVG
jgi:Zn-dependent protease with chaperone function